MITFCCRALVLITILLVWGWVMDLYMTIG